MPELGMLVHAAAEAADHDEQVEAYAEEGRQTEVSALRSQIEGMTFAEIGEVLGTTAGAAKLRAFRGYETLRRQLKGLL